MWKQFVAISASLLMLTGASADKGWRLHGGTQTDQRFSELNQINEQTVSRLGLVWSKELGTSRGLEATPIVDNGIIYTTGSWSIVFAFDARTGQTKWTYDPKVPRERAYFFCCDVVNRGVALHNGKIYVGTLDGRLIALDQHTGRPIEFPGVGDASPKLLSPEPNGAHNWPAMAFHPSIGLVYFPARVGTQMVHVPDRKWKYDSNRDNVGIDGDYEGPLFDKLASFPAPSGELVGWDPIAQKAVWRAKYPVVDGGGALATAGNLVLQGRADGIFAGYRATKGEQLWRFNAGTGIMAPPVTYTVDGVQYVTVMAGWGGAAGLMNTPGLGAVKPGWGRILTFALDTRATLKTPPFGHKDPPVPAITAKQKKGAVHAGALLFNSHCFLCHGLNAVAGPVPDLRYSSKQVLDSFSSIVLGGAKASDGMPSFKKILDTNAVKSIRAYIIARAQETAKPTQASQRR